MEDREKNVKKIIEGLSDMREAFISLAIALRDKDQNRSYMNFHMSQICEWAVNELARLQPQAMEIEGSERNWWYVCPECHGAIDVTDHYCCHCGQAVKRDA